MKVGSLFSGIGGFDLGFERAGFKTAWQVEKEPFCIAVLKTHFPDTERYYDVLKCGKNRIHKLRPVDVLTAGFPCQDLSVAGKRAGLEGSRSGLFWEVVRIVGELRPAWFVLENVPGLFSSNKGRDFAVVLNAMDELGYGMAWRVLNSQFFGVAQRRRRVFIVGCLGKPCPREVLFESEGGGWDIAEGEEARADIAGEATECAAISFDAKSGGDFRPGISDKAHISRQPRTSVAYCLREDPGGIGQGHNTNFVTQPIDGSWARGGSGKSDYPVGLVASTLGGRMRGQDACANNLQLANSLSRSAGHHGHSSPRGDGSDNLVVKRENRLVSSPINSHGMRDFAELTEGMDSARYRALGNAVTVSVAEWIARRIQRVTEDAKSI